MKEENNLLLINNSKRYYKNIYRFSTKYSIIIYFFNFVVLLKTQDDVVDL